MARNGMARPRPKLFMFRTPSRAMARVLSARQAPVAPTLALALTTAYLVTAAWAALPLIGAPTRGNADVLVGVNYFSGWWQGAGDKWLEPSNASVNWLQLYPERTPLLGEFNTQQTMDAEIEAAATHGVDFFQILYYDEYPHPREAGAQFLNRGLTNFVNSSNAHMMRFFIEYCNSLPLYGVTDDAEWDRMITNDWLPAFRHPSYLRVDGALVFKVINALEFFQNANFSSAVVGQRVNRLRQVVRDQGLGELVIGAGLPDDTVLVDIAAVGGAGLYNWTGLYAAVAQGNASQQYAWAVESAYVGTIRAKHEQQDVLPTVPNVMASWDSRPWGEPRPAFAFPTQEEWEGELERVLRSLQGGAMGFPRRDGSLQPAFNIYAWNEFGEGGIVAPTRGWGYSRLQGIKKVLGR